MKAQFSIADNMSEEHFGRDSLASESEMTNFQSLAYNGTKDVGMNKLVEDNMKLAKLLKKIKYFLFYKKKNEEER